MLYKRGFFVLNPNCKLGIGAESFSSIYSPRLCSASKLRFLEVLLILLTRLQPELARNHSALLCGRNRSEGRGCPPVGNPQEAATLPISSQLSVLQGEEWAPHFQLQALHFRAAGEDIGVQILLPLRGSGMALRNKNRRTSYLPISRLYKRPLVKSRFRVLAGRF